MNKYQEALNGLRLLEKDNVFSTSSLHPFVKKKIEILQELVDKETPMKPLLPKNGNDMFVVCHCPKCGTIIPNIDNYCPICGQKLYWE